MGLFLPTQKISLAMTYVENFLPNPPPYLGSSQTSKYSKFQPLLDFIPIYYPQTFFCNLFWTLGIYKGGTGSFELLIPSKLP